MSRSRSAGLLAVLPLYLLVATSLGFVDYHMRAYPDRGYAEYSTGVVQNTEDAPGRYRVLAPFAFQALTRVSGLAPRESWVLFRWLCLMAALLAGHVYLRTWFRTPAAVTGNLLVMALLPLTFTNGWAHPDHLMELALFTLACACLARGWLAAFVAVLVLNALNRETSVLLVVLFFASRPVTRDHLFWTAGVALTWLSTTAGLRWWRGFSAYDVWQAARNLDRLSLGDAAHDPYARAYAWFAVLILAAFTWLTVRAWARQPRFTRAALTVVTPALLATAFLASSIDETRIFTPLLPLLVPGALRGLVDVADDEG